MSTDLKPRKPRKSKTQTRIDAWQNAYTGIGTTRDKRSGTTLTYASQLAFEECAELLRSNPLAARIARRPAEEMTREWLDVIVNSEKDLSTEIENWLSTIDAPAVFAQALEWQRAYGGAGILLGVDDGNVDPSIYTQPRDPSLYERITHLTPFCSRELQATAYFSAFHKPKFGIPAAYRVVPQVPYGSGSDVANFGSLNVSQPSKTAAPMQPEIHESWILRFSGPTANRRDLINNYGWGLSVYQRVQEVLKDFDHTWASVANLLQDFAQAILSIPGLTQMLASEEGKTAVANRLQVLDMTRSNSRLIALDGGDSTGADKEEFRREVASLAGVSDILGSFGELVAAASDMPLVILLGLSPKGLGNEGAADLRGWYDHVGALQRKDMLPQIRALIGAQYAEALSDKTWSVVPRPLWTPDETTQAQTRTSMAQADIAYIQAGVLMPEEVRSSRFGSEKYSLETQLDESLRLEFEEAEEPEAEAQDPSEEEEPKAKVEEPKPE